MLSFTPTVETAMRWFDATHELDGSAGVWRWRRIGLPGPGSVGEQDAQLMDALDLLRRVHNDIVRPKEKSAH